MLKLLTYFFIFKKNLYLYLMSIFKKEKDAKNDSENSL